MVPKLVAGNRVLAELGFGLASNYLERGYFQSWINCIITSYKSAFASDAKSMAPGPGQAAFFFDFLRSQSPVPSTHNSENTVQLSADSQLKPKLCSRCHRWTLQSAGG